MSLPNAEEFAEIIKDLFLKHLIEKQITIINGIVCWNSLFEKQLPDVFSFIIKEAELIGYQGAAGYYYDDFILIQMRQMFCKTKMYKKQFAKLVKFDGYLNRQLGYHVDTFSFRDQLVCDFQTFEKLYNQVAMLTNRPKLYDYLFPIWNILNHRDTSEKMKNCVKAILMLKRRNSQFNIPLEILSLIFNFVLQTSYEKEKTGKWIGKVRLMYNALIQCKIEQ